MRKQLGDEDGRAVDLLLDGSSSAAGNGNGGNGQGSFAVAVGASFHQRLQSAEKVLQVLAEMPAPEPSVDLLAKTMRRIDESNLRDPASQPPLPASLGDDTQPTA
jgi:hypothetical protein